jgi:NAD(P)H-dependent flavin oxidoreductase YrpB (nitropropane dioxygenase family)
MNDMRTSLCERLGIEYPIFAFSRSRGVVAAVTNAGGFGVLGAAAFAPEELDRELRWIDEQVGDRPYGIDLVLPVKYEGDDPERLRAAIPEEHRRFVQELMRRFAIPPRQSVDADSAVRGHVRARAQWSVAVRHPVRLLASAIGPLPSDIQEQAHDRGILTAGLVGDPRHAVRHVEAGTDIVVAQGSEAGGHTGEIATMLLLPQVVDALAPRPVLAAGGIGDGRQIAAALAMGAEGVWTGSIWLTVTESDAHPLLKRKLLRASSRDTVRSRCRTGKPVRQLRIPWVDAWESPGAPAPLRAPLQQLLVRDATISAIEHGIDDALGSPVGQVVGMMTREWSARELVRSLVEQYLDAVSRLSSLAAATTVAQRGGR